MNNAILFFFNINVSNMKRINNNYYFNYLNNNYGVYLYNRDITDSIYLYNLNLELLQRGIPGYYIILTKNREVIFQYENNYYILMKFPSINNRNINYEDIKNFNIEIDSNKYKKIDKSNWSNSWSNKIDFIEYQFKQMKNKYKIIDTYIDYYIGLWENAISYFNFNQVIKNKYICHKRVSVDMDLYEYLNPLTFIIDYKERDIGEYLKSFVMTKSFSLNSLNKYLDNLNRDSIILIISRLLFPSYFFDLYENIIIDKIDENEILKIISKNSNIINTLKYIFNRFSYMNISYIDWIKKEIS